MPLPRKLPPKPNKPHKLTKHDLCGHIMAMKNLPADTTTDTKNEVLLNIHGLRITHHLCLAI